MLNKLKKTTLAAVTTAATLLGSGQAWALQIDGTDPRPPQHNLDLPNITGGPVGSAGDRCQLSMFTAFQDPSSGDFFVLRLDTPNGSHFPGGVIIGATAQPNVKKVQTVGPAISQAVIADCLNAPTSEVLFEEFSAPSGSSGLAVAKYGFAFTFQGRRCEYFYEGSNVTTFTVEFCNAPLDTTLPVITLTGDDPVEVLLNENYTDEGATADDAEDGDLTGDIVVGGDMVDTSSVGSYTITYDVTDSSGNAATRVTRTVNVSAPPEVVLSGGPDAITGTTPFTVTATFSKDVTGFNELARDVTVGNGSVTAITGGPKVYTLTITPTGNGDVLITVPVAAAQDSVGNDNTVSNTLVIGNQIVEITQNKIAGFMLGRANSLASNQPGLTRFLMGEGCGTFNANATQGSGSVNGCVSRGNTWAEITSSWSGDDSYTLGTIGAHGFVNPNLLIGGMLQFDRAEDSANNASGTGYMIGPYFVAQVPDQPLFFEGRLLYGQTDNEISPLGTYTDSFETERWLAQLRATGEYQVQNTTLMPLLDFTYTDDTQKAYTDSLGNTIPGQTVSLMQLSAGMDFSTPLPVSMGALDLTGGLSGIYSSSDGAAAAPEFENWRGRTHLGLNYGLPNGARLSATTFYDGLGTDYESYGASIGFDMKF